MKYFLLFIIYLQIAVSVQAQDTIFSDHCTDCGEVLVGTAKVKFHAIQWQTTDSSTVGRILLLPWYAEWYGFTGASDSNKKLDPSKLVYSSSSSPNIWSFIGHSVVSVSQIIPNQSPYIGFYFSPNSSGDFNYKLPYSIESTGSNWTNKLLIIEGKGIADSETDPALTMAIKIDEAEATTADTADVAVSTQTNFSVTANIAPEKLLPTNISVDAVKYAMVEVIVEERNEADGKVVDDCELAQFSEVIQKQTTAHTEDNYYQSITGESSQTNCKNRRYYFLVSIGKPFDFVVKKQSGSTSTYTDYTFFIRGHYSLDSTKYPGSHHTFRLRTSDVPHTTNKLTVNVSGNGTVTSNDNKINCPINNCSSDYSVNTSSVTLTAIATNNNSTVTWDNKDCVVDTNDNSKAKVEMNDAKNCTVTFSSGTAPVPKINLTLKVNPEQAGTIKACYLPEDNNEKCIENITIPEAANNFTADENSKVTITATPTATPNEGYRFKEWQTIDDKVVTSNDNLKTSIDNDGVGTLTIEKLTTGASYTATFEKKSTSSTFKVTNQGDRYCFDASGLDSIISAQLKWTAVYSDGTKVLWGNDSSDTRTEITFCYPFDKSANVSLTANMNGEKTTYGPHEIKVNQLPVAHFTFTSEQKNGSLQVPLDASSSKDYDGSINSYDWDGNYTNITCTKTDNCKTAIAYFEPNKPAYVTLSVTDNEGKASLPFSQEINKPTLINEITAEPSRILLDDKLSSPLLLKASTVDNTVINDDEYSCNWSIKLSGSTESNILDQAACEPTFTNLVIEGDYIISLRVSKKDNSLISDTKSITVKAINPMLSIAEISVSREQDENGYSYFLLDGSSSYDPDALEEDKNAEIMDYKWEITNKDVCHVIPSISEDKKKAAVSFVHSKENQSCTVELTVTDNEQQTSQSSDSVALSVKKPTADFFSSFDGSADLSDSFEKIEKPLIVGQIPEQGLSSINGITFDTFNKSFDPDGVIQNYNWEIKNGDESIYPLQTSEEQQPAIITLSSLVSGNYTVKLTVTDNYGLTNSIEKNFIILPPLLGKEKETVQINPNSPDSESSASSYGGVIKNGEFLYSDTGIGVNSSDEITVVAGMQVDPAHVDQKVDQKADIIAVIGVLDLNANTNRPTFFVVDSQISSPCPLSTWDDKIASLNPLHKNVTLSRTINETVFQGNFAYCIGDATPFMITIYLGYRLTTGEIITNLSSPLTFGINNPISLTVSP